MDAVVCYPYIEPNQEWLTIAALCWERVHRITSVHAPPDSIEIQKLDSAIKGFLQPVYPDQAVTPAIEKQLREWLAARKKRQKRKHRSARAEAVEAGGDDEGFLLFRDKIPSQSLWQLLDEHGAIRKQKEVIQAPWWMHEYYQSFAGEFVRNARWNPTSGTAASAKARYDRYHAEARELEDAGDAEKAASLRKKAQSLYQRSLRPVEVDGPSVLVDKDVALYYLSAVASDRAAELKADLFAEESDFADYAANAKQGIVGHSGGVLLKAYLPADSAKVDPQKIAEYRNVTEKERLKFQKTLQSLISEYQSVSSEDDLERLKRVVVELAKERVEQTQKAYQHARIETIIKAFGISLAPPALISWLASTLHVGVFVPSAIAGTIALFGVQMLVDREKAAAESENSGWSYVLKTRKHFKAIV